jgi:hypothetical protein
MPHELDDPAWPAHPTRDAHPACRGHIGEPPSGVPGFLWHRLAFLQILANSLSLLKCILPDKHRVLPVFSRNRSELNPLEAILTRMLISVDCKELTGALSLLDATLTKNLRVGAHPPSPRSSSLHRHAPPSGPLQAALFGATIRKGTKLAASRGKQIPPGRCLRIVSGHCFWCPQSGHRGQINLAPLCKSCLGPPF